MRLRTQCVLLLLFTTAILAVANDGVFYGSSGILKPRSPTRVRIQHEWLSIRFDRQFADVHVRFHFFSPDDTGVTLPVGFVVPCGAGDGGSGYREGSISRFTTQLNDRIQAYKLYELPCDTCELLGPVPSRKFESYENWETGPDFVFLSTFTFHPGQNVVTHSYRQRTGSSIGVSSDLNYVLTTAQHWAGQTIDTFECAITPFPNVICHVQGLDTIRSTRIVGTGKQIPLTEAFLTAHELIPVNGGRLFRILNGSIHYYETGFQPLSDLVISLLENVQFDGGHYEGQDSISSIEAMEERNTIYASHGLIFADTTVQREFERTSWYIPDPNCTVRSMHFTRRERDRLAWLNKQIKQLKRPSNRSPTRRP